MLRKGRRRPGRLPAAWESLEGRVLLSGTADVGGAANVGAIAAVMTVAPLGQADAIGYLPPALPAAAAVASTPFLGTPFDLPATIQAEDFDNGGEGVAYHDTTAANQGGAYRNTAVDVQTAPGGFAVGYVHIGEWLQYSIVPADGFFDVTIHAASASTGGNVHFSFLAADGKTVLGKSPEIAIASSGDWNTYQDVMTTGIAIPVAAAYARLTIDSGPSNGGGVCNLDYFTFARDTRDTVSLAATDPSGSLISGDQGQFTLSRMGDDSQDLTVALSISGSAAAGADYQPIAQDAVIPTGQMSKTIDIVPIVNPQATGSKTVIVSIAADSSYDIAAQSSGTVTLAGATAALGKLTWKQAASTLLGRSEAMGASVGGKLYVFGGFTDSTYHPTSESEVYDPVANQWTRIANLPVAMTNSGLAVVGQYIYLAGGYPGTGPGGSQQFATTAFYRYDTVSNTWTGTKDLPQLPAARGVGNLQAIGGVLHFFGGADINRKDTSNHWALDLNDLAAGWRTMAAVPKARNQLGGAVIGGLLYAVGGQVGYNGTAINQSEVDRYDPSTNQWTTVAQLPYPARSHISGSTFVYDGQIVTAGGIGPGTTQRLNVVQSYDPATNKWSSLTSLPSPRHSGVCDVIGDELVFTTGYNGAFYGTTWIGTFS